MWVQLIGLVIVALLIILAFLIFKKAIILIFNSLIGLGALFGFNAIFGTSVQIGFWSVIITAIGGLIGFLVVIIFHFLGWAF
ncbi:MAG: hypothetical protein ABIJ21_09220 [Nanoarchaeota archaeon]